MSATLDEHFGYISDSVRMQRFQQAISNVIEDGDVVVDLGCGFAPLGLMCLEAGAGKVWGIDESDALEIARDAAKRAGVGEKASFIRRNSFRAELPEQADVVICDHVGYFGVDYGIVALLDDARARFLKPAGKVVPGRLVLQAAGVTSARCRDLATRWGNPDLPNHYAWLDDYGANSTHPVYFESAEIATNVGDLVSIDFSLPSDALFTGDATLTAARDGTLDGLGGWFTADLVRDVTMTNSPLDPDRLQRQQLFLPFDAPMSVAAGDEIEVTIRIEHHIRTINWEAVNRRTGERRSQSTWRSQILSEHDLIPAHLRVPALTPTARVMRMVIDHMDGQRTEREIEDLVVREAEGVMPSEEGIRRFVRSALVRLSQ